ncbi:hypothetical protein DSN97_10845 [Deferribacteraceae bacterium V6Fe1]|nr:hypothetical protein DSN97_10845 [Deferribacteraceae bacterium V6Fe1]
MKKILILLVIFISACGYRFAGVEFASGEAKYKFYVSEIKNSYFESDYQSLLSDEVNDFFSKYGMLAMQDKADYIIKFDLISAKTESSITSVSNQAVASDINIKLKIYVSDQNSRVVYEKVKSKSESFNLTENISGNIQNRDDAFRKGIKNLLLDFKYEFENR